MKIYMKNFAFNLYILRKIEQLESKIFFKVLFKERLDFLNGKAKNYEYMCRIILNNK